MWRNWLARVAVAAVAISVLVTVLTGPTGAVTAQAATLGGQRAAATSGPQQPKVKTRELKARVAPHRTWNLQAAAVARRLVGDPYVWGGTSPAGFDCSGLTQYVYKYTGGGKLINRTAEEQFLQFRRISQADAHPGDLVFFHDTADPGSYVYHVGVYEGGDDMVAAATYGQGVVLQSFTWGGDTVTFGTITH